MNSWNLGITLSLGLTAALVGGCGAAAAEDPGDDVASQDSAIGETTPWGQLRDSVGNCLDVKGGAVGNRTPVQTYGCNGYGAQQWNMSTSSGPITNVKSRRVLDAPYVDDYSTTWIFDDWGGANQKWSMPSIELLGLGGKCMDVPYGTSGSKVWLFSCWNGENQKWTWDGKRIRTKDGRCLIGRSDGTVEAMGCGYVGWSYYADAQDGGVIKRGAPAGSDLWFQQTDGSFQNSASRLCLDVRGGSSADRTPIQMYSCNHTAAQRWNLRGALVGQQSGKCLTSLFGAGSQPALLRCDPARADQKWTFTPGETTPWGVFGL